MNTYICGFVAADGHISKTNRLLISQNEDGYALLLKIRNLLGKGKVREQKLDVGRIWFVK